MNFIEKSTLTFLSDLVKNNNKAWFEAHKTEHNNAKDNATAFGRGLAVEMNKYDVIQEAKVFRIYRDVRFSKDKTPYKNNLGIGFTRATAARRGGIYLNVEPGNMFFGCGFWDPNAPDLLRIRKEFGADSTQIKKIIEDKTFIKYFQKLEGEALKTAPKGFDKDHPDLELLRMKQYLFSRKFTDKEAASPQFLEECVVTFKAMLPFLHYMTEILTTNENGESIL